MMGTAGAGVELADGGLRIPGVDLLEAVGRGGFGTVYRGYQRALDRYVAVKVVPVDADQDTVLRRVQREMHAMGRLSNHACVVTVYDAGVLPGLAYLIMRYLPGGTLADRLEAGRLDVGFALASGARVASALAAAHEDAIIHGDVKPANVLLSAEGEAFLGDFGVSRLVGERTTQAFLTPGFAAPELLLGQMHAPSDVWALGATLFALLAGAPPRRQARSTVPFHEQVYGELRSRSVPDRLSRLIGATVAEDPSRRPEARLLAEELRRVGEAHSPAAPPGGAARGAEQAASAGPSPAGTPSAARPGFRVPPGGPAPAASRPAHYDTTSRLPGVAAGSPVPGSALGGNPASPPGGWTPVPHPAGPPGGAPPGGPASSPAASGGAPGPTGGSEPAPRPGRRRRRRIGVAGGIGALLVGAGAAVVAYLLFQARTSDVDPIGAPPEATVQPGEVSRLGAVSGLDGVGHQEIADAAELGGRVVAVGHWESAGVEPDYAAWYSDDGSTWTAANADEPLATDGIQRFKGVARIGDRLIAMGTSEKLTDPAVTLWLSSDGAFWTRVPYDAKVFDGPGSQVAFGATATRDRVIVAGFSDQTGDSDATIWLGEGRGDSTWRRATSPDLGGQGSQYAYSVAAVEEAVVAVGREGTNDQSDLAVWRSTDVGETWSRVASAAFEVDGYGELAAVKRFGELLVAVGQIGDFAEPDAVILVSRDAGRTWERVGEAVLGGAGVQALYNLAIVDGRLVAVGQAVGADGSCARADCADAGVWTSSDATTWTRVDAGSAAFGGDGEQHAKAAVALGDATIVVGTDRTGDDTDGAVWRLRD